MGAAEAVLDLVGDLLTALLGNHAHGDVLELIASVADDRGERSDLVGVDEDLADLSLGLELDDRTGRAAGGANRGGDAERNCGEQELTLGEHGWILLSDLVRHGLGDLEFLCEFIGLHAMTIL